MAPSTTIISRTAIRLAPFYLTLCFLAACAPVGPDYQEPQPDVPDHWVGDQHGPPSYDLDEIGRWWQVFDDPELSRLIEAAIDRNLDIKQAVSRVRVARQQRIVAGATLFPSVSSDGKARISNRSGNDGISLNTELYSASFDANWELDIFGGTRRSVEAASADIEAEIETLHDVIVTLLAEIAINYIDMRTLQKRLSVAESNVAAQQETWELLSALSTAGRGDELAVTQARYNLEGSRARIPELRTSLEQTRNRLAILINEPPGALQARLDAAEPIPSVRPDLAIGVPADTIRQRPDIREAERRLAAQTARIGEAEADRYPRFSLTGSIGIDSIDAGSLFSNPTRLWAYGPSFFWPIFEGGRIDANIATQKELRTQAFLSYQDTILSALEEVENALISYANEQQRLQSLNEAVTAARLAVQLAEFQYSTGLTGFSDVLDAQRSQLSFEDQAAQSGGAVVIDLVRLYKALGGGWQPYRTISQVDTADLDRQ
jgi:NodT family efflux transporter outer membrane factor (OMF) lipoprotein